jgi:hypothetical protein
MNDSVRSSGKPLFDDTKKSSKLDMSKSMVNFDDAEEDYIHKQEKSEDLFNNLVKNNIILEFHEVNGFLQSIGFERYIEAFLERGLDSVEKIKSIFVHYKDVKDECFEFIPYGHRMKIIKRIKELNNVHVRPEQHNVYEELPIKGDFNDIDDIEAYEAEQRQLFQQAVQQFRRGEPAADEQINEASNIETNTPMVLIT